MSLIVLLRNVTIQELLFPFGIQMVFSAEIAAHKAVKIAKQGIKCPVDFLFFTERLLTDTVPVRLWKSPAGTACPEAASISVQSYTDELHIIPSAHHNTV